MRFLIKEPAYIQGVYHPCPKGTTAILVLPTMQPGPVAEDGVAGEPEPFSHISLDWEPLDEEAQQAQIRVHQPKLSPDGVLEHHSHGREGTGQRVGYDPVTKKAVPWKGKRVLGKLLPMIDPGTKKVIPRPEFDHENTEAPLDRVQIESKSGEVSDDGEVIDPAVAARNLADRKAFVAFQVERRNAEAAAEREAAAAAEALGKPAAVAKPVAKAVSSPVLPISNSVPGKATPDNPIGA